MPPLMPGLTAAVNCSFLHSRLPAFSDDRTQAPCSSHDLYDKILSNKFNILKNSILSGHHFSLADHAPDGIQFSGIAGNLFHKIYNTPE